MIQNLDLIGVLVLLSVLVPLLIAGGGMVFIVDWLKAREKRKKAAAATKAAESTAAKPAL